MRTVKLQSYRNNIIALDVWKDMIRNLSLLILLALPAIGFGQFSLRTDALFGSSELLDEVQISQDGLYAGVEYHTRLKKKRLEFHPGIGYRFTWPGDEYDGSFSSIDLDLRTSIYPFDFGGDCNCPTFSKQGHLFKKGFFIEVAPGIGMQTFKRTEGLQEPTDLFPIQSDQLIFKLGGAIGLDIGISDHFTLTPMLSLTWLSPADWDGLHPDGSRVTLDDYSYMGAGIRLTYIHDPKRRK